MNPYEKLDQEKRTWDLKETAAFFGYTYKYFYKLVQQGRFDGCWVRIKRDYKFFPAKIKELLEKGLNGGGDPPKPSGPLKEPSEEEHGGEAA